MSTAELRESRHGELPRFPPKVAWIAVPMDFVLIRSRSAAIAAAHFRPPTNLPHARDSAVMHQSPETQTTFGYLSAVESPEHGFFGGYLVVSPLGRPLEFHCTAPVLPNRAQRILYGATLESYLLGEQIGGSLLAASKLAPTLILTDHAAFGLLRPSITVPLVLAGLANSSDATGSEFSDSFAKGTSASSFADGSAVARHRTWSSPFLLENALLQLPAGYETEYVTVAELVEMLQQRVELLEPFARIHEAVREAQRISTRSSELHGQAA